MPRRAAFAFYFGEKFRLDAVAENAVRVCSAEDATIRLVDRNLLRLRAHYGAISTLGATDLPLNRGSVTGRAVAESGKFMFIKTLQT
jgi:hypothetical protein